MYKSLRVNQLFCQYFFNYMCSMLNELQIVQIDVCVMYATHCVHTFFKYKGQI